MVGADGARVDGFRLWLYPSYGGWVRVGGGVCVAMWKRIAVYGLLLGLGTLALQWLDYQRMARLHMRGVYDFLLAAGVLALGLRSEEHTSELQSLMRIPYAAFGLTTKKRQTD